MKKLFEKIVVILASITILTILIAGCSTKEESKSQTRDNRIANQIKEEWQSIVDEETPEYLTKLNRMSSYEITSIEFEEGQYVINVTVTAPDLATQLEKLDYTNMPQINDVEKINEFLCEQIDLAEHIQTNTVLYANEIDGEFEIIFSDRFVDAMSGNVYSYSQTILLNALDEYKGGDR